MLTLKDFTISDYDKYLHREGRLFRSYRKLGSHPCSTGAGVHFAVWAPNANSVSVIGDFNHWDKSTNYLSSLGDCGIWEGVVENAKVGDKYKFFINSNVNNYSIEKADPLALYAEHPPCTASIIYQSNYNWGDRDWLENRKDRQELNKPLSIYELHLGSWKNSEGSDRPLTYRELAQELPKYIADLGFTHVEFMPITEHPFDGSWGYQSTGYFAPTSRFGSPDDFRFLIDSLHQYDIGVILDWVPGHFPCDDIGLSFFDGTALYEHLDDRLGMHPDWGTLIFNFGRAEVKNFLISSALFWLEEFHIDGLRVDAVASMLYLDYSRKEGEWIPNKYGGRENLEAIEFLKEFNQIVFEHHPDVITIAEESTAWSKVSRPTYDGGLGFSYKWNMGWMHDILTYFSKDPVYRSYHHNTLTFSLLYAFHENFVLPFSHDEVVHGKGSLLSKMPGDDWQMFANLRLLYTLMFLHPGKKLLFMGAEFAQREEWNHTSQLEWDLLRHESHRGVFKLIKDLNKLLKSQPAIYQVDFEERGFEWIDCNDWQGSVVSFYRRNGDPSKDLICAFNFTPVPRENYRIGVNDEGSYTEVFNSDSSYYWGSNFGNLGKVTTEAVSSHHRQHSMTINLPPLSGVVFKRSA